MRQFVEELHLAQHIGPIGAQLVHLQHHHLARRPMGHLRERGRERDQFVSYFPWLFNNPASLQFLSHLSFIIMIVWLYWWQPPMRKTLSIRDNRQTVDLLFDKKAESERSSRRHYSNIIHPFPTELLFHPTTRCCCCCCYFRCWWWWICIEWLAEEEEDCDELLLSLIIFSVTIFIIRLGKARPESKFNGRTNF